MRREEVLDDLEHSRGLMFQCRVALKSVNHAVSRVSACFDMGAQHSGLWTLGTI